MGRRAWRPGVNVFGPVSVQPRSLAEYKPLAGERACRELAEMGRTLRGLRVLHLTALAEGTRTTTLLQAVVPLMSGLGIATEWQVVPMPDGCQGAFDSLYRSLARNQKGWSKSDHVGWLRYVDLAAARFDRDFDFVVVHDPQPLAILTAKVGRDRSRPAGRWIWHCHLDLSGVDSDGWAALRPHLNNYDAAIYPAHQNVRADAGARRVVVIPPSLDPLALRNVEMPDKDIEAILRRYLIDPRRPLLVYVGPVTRESDPIGLIDAFTMAKPQVPGLQLVMIADSLRDDREGRSFFSLVAERARQDEVIRLLSSRNKVGEPEINAFLRAATVFVQRAAGRGQSPGILDAMWKERPVVAGREPGLSLQVADGRTGYLAGTTEEFGLRLVDLLRDAQLRAAMGSAGRERVRRSMLVTRCLRDYLALFQSFI